MTRLFSYGLGSALFALMLVASGCTQTAVKEEAPGTDTLDLSKVHFEYDSSKLTAEAKKLLREHAQTLKDKPQLSIQIAGHCDERGTEQYNLALGENRAKEAKKFLVTLGISSDRIATLSLGESHPDASGSGESAWSKNRRAEFEITNQVITRK